MAKKKTDHEKVVRIAVAGILTAIVIVFQFIGASIKFGTFSISLVLVPIVIGAALGGKWVSTWLGIEGLKWQLVIYFCLLMLTIVSCP